MTTLQPLSMLCRFFLLIHRRLLDSLRALLVSGKAFCAATQRLCRAFQPPKGEPVHATRQRALWLPDMFLLMVPFTKVVTDIGAAGLQS